MLESTRRKRRKISQGDEHPVPREAIVFAEHMTWHDQLTSAASSSFEQTRPAQGPDELDRSANQPISTVHNPFSESQVQTLTNLETSRHTNIGLSSNLFSELSPSLREKDPALESDLTPIIPASAEPTMPTPKKKGVRLGANGKLTSSPKQAQKRSPQSGIKAVAKVASKSRVEMKNGKFVSSLKITLSYTSPGFGRKIDEILSIQPALLNDPSAQVLLDPKSITEGGTKTVHPFFRGKLLTKTRTASRTNSESASTAPASEDEARTSPKAPKPWKNIIFGSRKSSQKLLPGIDPIWPPNELHNIQPEVQLSLPRVASLLMTSKSKSRQIITHIDAQDDVLRLFGSQLKSELGQPPKPVHLPTRTIMSGRVLFDTLTLNSLAKPVVNVLKSRIETHATAFDRGMASGPHLWPQEYAPACWGEVLQPQAQILHDWLINLEVHNVQSGHIQAKAKPAVQKKRRKRKSDEMDDFIAGSDDDELNNKQPSKNAILLTGPSGCGKTASVYAVARQLGFEIFEIHPGMRRNARDIMDQVGDMTQNHLVQKATGISSRRSSMSASDAEGVVSLPVSPPANQQTMAAFMQNGKKNKNPVLADAEGNKEIKARAQKQSLILLEEVDILFDEDKGFWTAVQALIQTSKRPVILTCNDASSVPTENLNLYATLEYEKPSPDVAIQYLRGVAASEGHLLSYKAIRSLYLSTDCDLRASLTELNLWCQMTVGSQRGGIDWMMPYSERQSIPSDGSVTRIVSKDTFINGHGLLPTDTHGSDELICFAMDQLDISALDWVSNDLQCSNNAPGLQQLDDLLSLCEARSCMDILDDSVSPLMAGQIRQISASEHLVSPRDELVDLYLSPRQLQLPRSKICEAMYPLSEEIRIGLPQPPGRKSPSMDTAATSVVTDLAPYVRYIVRHDQRLEALRNDLDGGSQSMSNKRQRRTRAARAALEGGTKANTRRDKWFTDSLDFDAVLSTGGAWQQAQSFQLQESMEETNVLGPSSSVSPTEMC